MARKRVYVIYTGGTIGMRRQGAVYGPEAGYLRHQLEHLHEDQEELPTIQVSDWDPLLDSSDVGPAHWQRLAEEIRDHQEFDGFVVLHGTDTMAYTASALSFMLDGLDKPIIITGSQIPLCEIRSDARDNVIDALMVAGHEHLAAAEVMLLFNGSILRGNRSTKVSADDLDAFESPNYPALGHGGVHLTLYKARIRPPAAGPLTVTPLEHAHVAAMRLFPGMEGRVLREVLREPTQGVVLEAFGVGNAPTEAALWSAIEEATGRGVVVVVCTQCVRGSVNLESYAAGAALARAGAISGHDMTVEAAMTKLFWLLGQGLPPDDVKTAMESDLRGEITLPDDPRRAIL